MGSRWPKPQRVVQSSRVIGTEEQNGVSADVLDPFTIGMTWWSYQPSESSQVTMIAVDFQYLDSSIWLMVLTRKFCSSSGVE
jgi:hypothetical protein